MDWLLALISCGGAIVQGTTGFGFGIFVMIFFPLLMPYLSALGISTLAGMGGNVVMCVRYWKKVRFRYVWLPFIMDSIFVTGATWLVMQFSSETLKPVLGGALMCLSVYFLFFAKRIRLRPRPLTACTAGALAGTIGGIFGMGGPPVVLYFLAVCDDKEEYLGTIQFFFLLTSVYSTLMRIVMGAFTLELVIPLLWAYGGVLVGSLAAAKLVKRISVDLLRKLVYGFIGLAGLWLLITGLA